MSYRCCSMIQNFTLTINGRIDDGTPVLSLCCEGLPNIPKIPFAGTAEASLRAFVGAGMLAAVECAQLTDDSRRHYTAGCVGCAHFRKGDWTVNPLIGYVNLSMYPAPCQCRCIYCDACQEYPKVLDKTTEAAYEKLFDMLELAERCGILSPGAKWQVSSGEITIHPYHDRIMELVRGKRAVFYTNCMKFDEAIAQNLHDNPSSAINLSIDSGTAETWKAIKGVDNFDKILENLARYHAVSTRPGQITLKYILLPGVNDVFEDYLSLMEIIKTLEVQHLALSRDVRTKYSMSREESIRLAGSAASLLALCRKQGISTDMFNFTQEEQTEALRLAGEILEKGLI